MKRIFAAIKVEPSEELTRLHFNLKTAFRSEVIKWVELNNLHLTLKFFGETAEDKIPAIHQAFEKIAKNQMAFRMTFNGLGIFGSKYKPRVIWLGIDKNDELLHLAKTIIHQMNELDFKGDRQNFVPHLSMGRIKSIDDKNLFFDHFQKLKTFHCEPVQIGRFHLFESKLYPSGSEYSILHTYDLA